MSATNPPSTLHDAEEAAHVSTINVHDLEKQAARKALEMARNAIMNSQYDPAPYCRALSQLAKIDPAQFRTDQEQPK